MGAVARSSRRRAPLGSRSQRISGPGSLASVVHAAGCRAAGLLAIARHRDLGEVVAPRATALMTLPSLNGVVGSGIARNLKRLGRRDQARSQIGTSLRPRRTGRDGFPSSGSPVLSLALSCFAVFGVLGGSSDVLLRRLRLLLGQPAMASGLLRFASGLEEISCVGLGLGCALGHLRCMLVRSPASRFFRATAIAQIILRVPRGWDSREVARRGRRREMSGETLRAWSQVQDGQEHRGHQPGHAPETHGYAARSV